MIADLHSPTQTGSAPDTAAVALPPSNTREDTLQITALCRFARTLGISEEIAIIAYRNELQRLKADAKVTHYVTLLADKAARDALRKRARQADCDPLTE